MRNACLHPSSRRPRAARTRSLQNRLLFLSGAAAALVIFVSAAGTGCADSSEAIPGDAAALLALANAGAQISNRYPPGVPADLDGDGTNEGSATDVDGDGRSDGVDIDSDGDRDLRFLDSNEDGFPESLDVDRDWNPEYNFCLTNQTLRTAPDCGGTRVTLLDSNSDGIVDGADEDGDGTAERAITPGDSAADQEGGEGEPGDGSGGEED